MEMRTGKGVAGGLGGSEKKGNPQIPTLLVCFYVCVCTDGLVRTGGSSVSVCLAADDYRTCLAIFHGLRPLRPPSPPHPSTSRCWPSLVDTVEEYR